MPSPTADDLSALGAFLADPAGREEPLTMAELRGFLFAVACAPDRPDFDEVLDYVFDGAMPENLDRANEILAGLVALHNEINEEVLRREPKLPPEIELAADPMENFDPERPLAQWARGFVKGQVIFGDAWERLLPEELEDELAANFFVLGYFSSRERAESVDAERRPDELPLEALAAKVAKLFRQAMRSHAHLGRTVYEAFMEAEAQEAEAQEAEAQERATEPRLRVGRNDPCPCGSGRKYKRCCGATMH